MNIEINLRAAIRHAIIVIVCLAILHSLDVRLLLGLHLIISFRSVVMISHDQKM